MATDLMLTIAKRVRRNFAYARTQQKNALETLTHTPIHLLSGVERRRHDRAWAIAQRYGQVAIATLDKAIAAGDEACRGGKAAVALELYRATAQEMKPLYDQMEAEYKQLDADFQNMTE